MEENLMPVRQRGFPDQATRSLQPALPAYLSISQWKRGISDSAKMESSHSIPCAGSVRLTWCFQKDSWKEWAYLGYFYCWAESQETLGLGSLPLLGWGIWDTLRLCCSYSTGFPNHLAYFTFLFGYHLHHFLCLLCLAEQAGEKADLHHLVLFGSDLHF